MSVIKNKAKYFVDIYLESVSLPLIAKSQEMKVSWTIMTHNFNSPPGVFDSDSHQVQFNYLFDQILAVIKLDEEDRLIRAKTLT